MTITAGYSIAKQAKLLDKTGNRIKQYIEIVKITPFGLLLENGEMHMWTSREVNFEDIMPPIPKPRPNSSLIPKQPN